MTVTPDKKNVVSVLSDENEIFGAAAAALRDKRPLKDTRLKEAANAFQTGALQKAEQILAAYLERRSDDPRALHLLGETARKLGRNEHAEALLARCVAAAPDYDAGRLSYASVLYQRNRLDASLAQLEVLIAADPCNVLPLDLKAAVLTAMGRHHDSMLCRRQLAENYPNAPELWVKYGTALRSVGERDAAVDALKHALALDPSCGNGWWTLAGMKTWRFSEAEIAAMETALAGTGKKSRTYLHFALGKAYADEGNWTKSWDHYARANAMKRLTITYDPDWLGEQAAKIRTLFTREFLETRSASGCPSAEPIFIVGMQRAGSTLVEQILGSHSAIEATAELPDITLMVESLAERGSPYPGVLASLDGAALSRLGESYLDTTRLRRRRGLLHFVDKHPYNFLHVGLIHLILPNAKIIDVRRHPLACCWSNFSAHFETGALFAYRFGELGRAYRDYLEAMARFDAVLPGRVYRVIYEDLVEHPREEIRRLLAHLGLPFEEACLSFHTNARAMNSVSSEQVRRPIYRESLEQWRNYEPWLGPLKSALGHALDAWR